MKQSTPRELAYSLLAWEQANLVRAHQTCPNDQAFAYSVADEALFLGCFADSEARVAFAQSLFTSGAAAEMRRLLAEKLAGRQLAESEFAFLDGISF